MNALRKIHAALVPGGVVVDTQPVTAWPEVRTAGGACGALDMREWVELIAAIDEQVDATIREGLFASELKPSFEVVDTFDSGPALAATVKNWQGTSLPAAVAERLARVNGSATVRQEVRMRLLRAL